MKTKKEVLTVLGFGKLSAITNNDKNRLLFYDKEFLHPVFMYYDYGYMHFYSKQYYLLAIDSLNMKKIKYVCDDKQLYIRLL